MPPPPPPPAPPPMPKLGVGAPAKSSSAPSDRNALLSQIRKGTNLKKAETNDKSAPVIDGSKSVSNGSVKRNADIVKSNGPFPLIPPGGLFAQGIPKLRPTVPRSGDSSPFSSLITQSLKSDINSSPLDHLRIGHLGNSRSQPPSPVSKPRIQYGATASHNVALNSVTSESASRAGGNLNFPDDLNIKGPAPAPPPQCQKPNFKTGTSDEPKQHPTVKRSASQTNIVQRPRLRPPPNVKPPPPPKTNIVAPLTAPPPPPSKPPNIARRQSFGVGEGRMASSKLNVASTISNGSVKSASLPPPPPPPRNNSAPNDLNQIGSSQPLSKMNIAPPPPPPNRVGAVATRGAPVRPPPPRAPPPPPMHQFPAPPSQMKAALTAANMAPPPPLRVSSMKQSSEFEQRFMDRFQAQHCLPKPDRYPNTQKSYPSKAARQKQSQRRQPPPPPPQGGQPVLHIQLDSGIFSSYSSYS